jgi:hypothetical protein
MGFLHSATSVSDRSPSRLFDGAPSAGELTAATTRAACGGPEGAAAKPALHLSL